MGANRRHIYCFFLGIIAYDFLKESFAKFVSGDAADFGIVAIIVTAISVVVKEALAQYAFYIARKTDNSAVRADGWHHRMDALSSVVVLVGIALKDYFWWIDSALGFVISILLLYAAFEIMKDAINKILGEKPSPEIVEKVKNVIIQLENDDLDAHHFHLHNYGTHKELTFHIKLASEHTIGQGHRIATRLENSIREQLYIESTIHVEPLGFNH